MFGCAALSIFLLLCKTVQQQSNFSFSLLSLKASNILKPPTSQKLIHSVLPQVYLNYLREVINSHLFSKNPLKTARRHIAALKNVQHRHPSNPCNIFLCCQRVSRDVFLQFCWGVLVWQKTNYQLLIHDEISRRLVI